MDTGRTLLSATFGILLTLAAFSASAQDAAEGSRHSDNTIVNTRDRNSNERTADQAKNNLSDRDLMKKIRRSIMRDKSISMYGHNVKIISENGAVTLKGPVRSENERKRIVAKAVEVAGEDNVEDELSIKSK